MTCFGLKKIITKYTVLISRCSDTRQITKNVADSVNWERVIISHSYTFLYGFSFFGLM